MYSGYACEVLKYDDPLVGFVARATFFHPYVEAVPFARRGVTFCNQHFALWVLVFYTLMRWYVSHDPVCFPCVPTICMFATTMLLCNFSERTRCSVGAWSHLRTCFLYVVAVFLCGRVHFRFPCRCIFCRLLIPLSCLRCTWSDFILTAVPFSVWETPWETLVCDDLMFACVAPATFQLYLCWRCIFPSLRPWLNGCAAGSLFGSRT